MKCDFCERTDSDCRIRTIKNVNYCPTHITRHYRHQPMEMPSIYDPNEIVILDDHAEIVLKDCNCIENGRAIIDTDDLDKCQGYKWHLHKGISNTDYVIASLPGNQKIHLHRLILGYDGPDDVDHINLNGLDNRKENLRVVPHRINAANNKATGVKKVPSGRYQAAFCRNYKTIYVGTFNTEEEALIARQRAVKEYDAKYA